MKGLQDTPEVLQASDNYHNIVDVGTYKSQMPASKIFVLGCMAGVHIAFGGFLMLTISGNMPGLAASNYGLSKLISALVFPVGLLMVLLGGAELFTGNTFTVTTAFFAKKISFRDLLKSWFFSYTGNFVGSLLMVAAVVCSGIMVGNTAAVNMAVSKSSVPLGQVFIRAVLANWLVCIAVFQAYAASSLPGKLLGIWGPISMFVTIGLEHSVANMFIIPLGIMLGANVSFTDFLVKNLIPVTIGNAFAGVVFMAAVYTFAYGGHDKSSHA